MKTIQNLFLIIILFCSQPIYSQIKYVGELDKLTEDKRNTYLLALAKEVVENVGPGYYLKNEKAEITKAQIYNFSAPGTEKDHGRYYYTIRQSYDSTKMMFAKAWTFQLNVWVDTGEPESIMFGNGIGVLFHGSAPSYRERIEKGIKKKVKFQCVDLTDMDRSRYILY